MKIKLLFPTTLGAGLFLASTPAFSHHAFSAEYDALKPVTIKAR